MKSAGGGSVGPHRSLEGALIDIKLRAESLRRNRFARSTAALAGGTAVAQLLAVLISPALTRMYTPSNFGVLAAYASLIGILSVAASLKYELAIPLPEDEESALNLLALALLLAVGSCLVWAIVVAFAGGELSRAMRVPALEPYLPLIPLGVLFVGVYQALNYWAIRKNAFRLIARTRIVQSVDAAAVQLGLGVAVSGPGGLLLGSLVGQAAGGGSLVRPLWATRERVRRAVSSSRIRVVAGRYRRFPIFSTGSAVLNSVGILAPAFLLSALYGTQVGGWYALADRVSRVPLTLVGTAVGQVYLSRAALLAREAPQRLLVLYLRATRHLLVVGVVLVALTATLAPVVFPPVFGPGWRNAGTYVALLSAMLVAQFVFNPLSQTLYVLEKQSLVMALDTLRAFVAVGALTLPRGFDLPATWAIACFSVAMTSMYVLYWTVALYRLRSFAHGEAR